MNARIEKPVMPTGLELLRQPFPENQVSKLPKPTKAQTDAVKTDFKAGIRCDICGTWHHPKVVHLDYVGHAALTDRLLDCDPAWNWEPVAMSPVGVPLVDASGGMWIRLTVCGVTRLGYGHADKGTSNKSPGDVTKELIGDAMRNAAMRFGAALDLWHKGQLHADDDLPAEVVAPKVEHIDHPHGPSPADIAAKSLNSADTIDQLAAIFKGLPLSVKSLPEVIGAKDNRKSELQNAAFDADEIPY